MYKRIVVSGLILLVLTGFCPLTQAQQVRKAQPVASAAPAPGSVGVPLRDGDTIELRIANVPADDAQQFNGSYTLDESGMINLPYIGSVKAGGSAASQVQTMVQDALVKAGIYTMPIVSVNPAPSSRFVTVSGAVRQPSRVPYSSDLTLMTTINAVGGPSDFAGDKIRLIRGGKVTFFSRHRLTKDPSKDPPIEPGDQIEILESMF